MSHGVASVGSQNRQVASHALLNTMILNVETNFFQIFLPTPNVKVSVVLKGHNSDHGWTTVCRILTPKMFGATLNV